LHSLFVLLEDFHRCESKEVVQQLQIWALVQNKKRESRDDLLLEIVENTDKISLCNIF